jgi:DNA-binding response OmpR family regulator
MPDNSAICQCCGQPLPPDGLMVDLDSTQVRYGAITQRVPPQMALFLAALLENRGKPLHVERIAQRLWDYDETPDTYRNLLHVYACRARKFLEPLGFTVHSAGRGKDPTFILTRVKENSNGHEEQVSVQLVA